MCPFAVRGTLHVVYSRRGLCSNDDVIVFPAKKMTSSLLHKLGAKTPHVTTLLPLYLKILLLVSVCVCIFTLIIKQRHAFPVRLKN